MYEFNYMITARKISFFDACKHTEPGTFKEQKKQYTFWASFIKAAVHKKMEVGMECAYASFTADIRIMEKLCAEKLCVLCNILSPMVGPHAKFFRLRNQRHSLVRSPNKAPSSNKKKHTDEIEYTYMCVKPAVLLSAYLCFVSQL